MKPTPDRLRIEGGSISEKARHRYTHSRKGNVQYVMHLRNAF